MSGSTNAQAAPRRVLVTGCAGFVGAPAVRALVDAGASVTLLLRRSTDRARLSSWGVRDRIDVIEGDLRDLRSAAPALRGGRFDAALHLAWSVDPRTYLHSADNIDWIGATAGLATTLAEAGCPRFVGVGTCFEYDLAGGYLRPDSATRPETLYGVCKLAAYDVLRHTTARFGTAIAWARLFFLYGPGEPEGRLVSSVLRGLLAGDAVPVSTGEQHIDLLHVADAGRALAALTLSDVVGAVNVGSGEPVRVRHVLDAAEAVVPGPGHLLRGARAPRPTDPAFICADATVLRSVLGWEPRYALHAGLRDTAAWWAVQRTPALSAADAG